MCRSRPRRRAPGSARRSNPGNGPRVPRPGPGRDTRNRSRTRRSPRGRRSSGTRPGRCSWRHDSQVSTDREPRIDLHSHAGRCFLAGLPAGHSLVTTLGAASVVGAVRTARAAGMTALVLAAVADFAVLRPDPATGLRAHRDFRTGEAYADYQRQLAGIREAAAEAGAEVATSAADLDRAVRDGHTAVLLGCEGGDFLEGDLRRLERARAAGLTVLTLVHYRVSEIGDVQTEAPVYDGLSRFGRDVVAECNRLGIVIDCAHASFATTMAVLAASSQPVIISHGQLGYPGTNHSRTGHPRLMTAQHAAAVAEAGGRSEERRV